MATLSSLPNELLVTVLTACPDPRTILRLSSTNRRLQSIWLVHTEAIIKSIIARQSPGYTAAVKLVLAR